MMGGWVNRTEESGMYLCTFDSGFKIYKGFNRSNLIPWELRSGTSIEFNNLCSVGVMNFLCDKFSHVLKLLHSPLDESIYLY